jgi:hypothetical protein
VRRQDEGESIERDRLIVVRALDFALTRHIHVVVMVRGKMRMDERGVVVIVIMTAVVMNVLERRAHECRHECQTAWDRGDASHQENCTRG